MPSDVEALLADPAHADNPLLAVCRKLHEERTRLHRRLERIGRISDGYQSQLRELNRELVAANDRLGTALSEVRTLRGFVPICSRCKKVRDDEGYWDEVESYLGRHSEAVLSQGVCPDCSRGVDPQRRFKSADENAEETRRLNGVLQEHTGNPLLPEHVRLSKRYARLSRRLDKISKISDGFQSQLKDLNAVLQRDSLTDPLTGIANRRGMVDRLQAETNRAARGGKTFSLLMVDLDHFKRINDNYGHEAGDQVIKEVARLLRENLRSFDLCARWGGEEFLVLLADTTSDQATSVAEKLRGLVESQPVAYAGHQLIVTLSAGLATHDPETALSETLREADRALYAAKQTGRNKLVTAETL